MKVEQEKEFKPITITLETEQEANAMFAHLIIEESGVYYIVKKHGVMVTEDECIKIFREFRKVYDPRLSR